MSIFAASRALMYQFVAGRSFERGAYDKVMADPFAGRLFAEAEKMVALGVVSKQGPAGLAVSLASSAAAKITGQAVTA